MTNNHPIIPPLKFIPLHKEALWGSESWQLSGVEGSETIVSEGHYQGLSLNELTSRLQGLLLGEANYRRFGNRFPLLIKFIDAQKDLSIQVHPSDEIAAKKGLPCGKTEMWYIMKSKPDAMLYCGLKDHLTPESYAKAVEEDAICDALAQYAVKEGDVFFLPAGRIHAIGAGCLLAEIQQTSDVTYRIYDFKRRDKDGNYRELHTEQAAECIDYNVLPSYRTSYTPQADQGVSLVQCPYFNTAVYDLREPMTIDYADLDSFVIFTALEGEAIMTDDAGHEFTLRGGESVLLPATVKTLQTKGVIKFLETFLPY